MTAPRMTFPGPKRISGLVSGSCLYFPSAPLNNSEKWCLNECGVVGAIRLKYAGRWARGWVSEKGNKTTKTWVGETGVFGEGIGGW